ncbi:unnamed protein product [Caenorhabditis auriculariae]|uniref:Uncharacterized protein n=1 Tax=Caenorhabditis auriculariae TaxID=2777116 RepID=A0A8S1GY84_9PELO|nr:unnamed protein product [Caenorhabditis auriculariae]
MEDQDIAQGAQNEDSQIPHFETLADGMAPWETGSYYSFRGIQDDLFQMPLSETSADEQDLSTPKKYYLERILLKYPPMKWHHGYKDYLDNYQPRKGNKLKRKIFIKMVQGLSRAPSAQEGQQIEMAALDHNGLEMQVQEFSRASPAQEREQIEMTAFCQNGVETQFRPIADIRWNIRRLEEELGNFDLRTGKPMAPPPPKDFRPTAIPGYRLTVAEREQLREYQAFIGQV